MFRAACLQVNAGTDLIANIDAAVSLARSADQDGADLILMPENVSTMVWGRAAILNTAYTEEEHPALESFRELACELAVWIHCGSLSIKLGGTRVANRSYVISPEGTVSAWYDKVHMFDVDLGNGQKYAESSTFSAGNEVVLADLPWGKLGLTICYDLRFPYLYRALAKSGAFFITVPSAFTRITGEAHWHTLLRARAIETGCYIFAPAQTGDHGKKRKTYGHALIINPWGEVVCDAGTKPGFVISDIHVKQVESARSRIPSLFHDRELLIRG